MSKNLAAAIRSDSHGKHTDDWFTLATLKAFEKIVEAFHKIPSVVQLEDGSAVELTSQLLTKAMSLYFGLPMILDVKIRVYSNRHHGIGNYLMLGHHRVEAWPQFKLGPELIHWHDPCIQMFQGGTTPRKFEALIHEYNKKTSEYRAIIALGEIMREPVVTTKPLRKRVSRSALFVAPEFVGAE